NEMGRRGCAAPLPPPWSGAACIRSFVSAGRLRRGRRGAFRVRKAAGRKCDEAGIGSRLFISCREKRGFECSAQHRSRDTHAGPGKLVCSSQWRQGGGGGFARSAG